MWPSLPLITAIGSHKHELREALLSVIEGTGFTLFDLEEVEYETPLIEEDGRHNWTCEVSVIPENATFKDLFLLRDNLSQTAFLHLNAIETPYLALRRLFEVNRGRVVVRLPDVIAVV